MRAESQKDEAPREGVLIGAFVDPTLKASVETIAARNDRSVSAELRRALRRHVALEDARAAGYFKQSRR